MAQSTFPVSTRQRSHPPHNPVRESCGRSQTMAPMERRLRHSSMEEMPAKYIFTPGAVWAADSAWRVEELARTVKRAVTGLMGRKGLQVSLAMEGSPLAEAARRAVQAAKVAA